MLTPEQELTRLNVRAWARRTNAAADLVEDCPRAAEFVAALDLRHFLSGADLERRAELLKELDR